MPYPLLPHGRFLGRRASGRRLPELGYIVCAEGGVTHDASDDATLDVTDDATLDVTDDATLDATAITATSAEPPSWSIGR